MLYKKSISFTKYILKRIKHASFKYDNGKLKITNTHTVGYLFTVVDIGNKNVTTGIVGE